MDQDTLLSALSGAAARLAASGLPLGELGAAFAEQMAALDMSGVLLLLDAAGERLVVRGLRLALAAEPPGMPAPVNDRSGEWSIPVDAIGVLERTLGGNAPVLVADAVELWRPLASLGDRLPGAIRIDPPGDYPLVCLPLACRSGEAGQLRGLLCLSYPGLAQAHLPALAMYASLLASSLAAALLGERLRDSEQRLTNVFDSVDCHMALVADNGDLLAVNRAWREFAVQNGAGEESAWGVGANYFSVAQRMAEDGGEADAATRGIRRVAAGEIDMFELDYPCHSPGRERWFHMRVLPVRGGSGSVLVAHSDITERKLVEGALRDREQALRSLVRAAPVGIGTLLDRVLLSVNRRFCDLTGYAEDELVGRNSRLLYFSDAEYQRVGREKYAMIREQGIGAVETRFRRKDGKALDIWLSSAWLDGSDPSAGITFTAMDITERKKAERRLRASEERFRSLFENAAAGIATIDSDGEITDVNPTFARMLGYSAEELRQRKVRDITHPNDWPGSLRLFESVRAGNAASLQIEKRYIKKDGRPLWCLLSLSGLFDEGGRAIESVALIQDIDRRKRIEGDLTLFRTLIDQTTDIVAVVDPDSRTILDCNVEACRSLDYEREHLIDRSLLDLTTMFDSGRPDWERFLGEFSPGRRREFECDLKRRDGSLFPVEVRAAHVRAGEQTFLVGVARDIGGRRAMEQELRRRTAELEVVLNVIPAPVYLKDKDLRLSTVNQAYCDFVGRSKEQLIGQVVDEVFSPEGPEGAPGSDRGVLASGERVVGLEQQLRDASGQWRWCSTSKTPLVDADGEVTGVVGISVDISDIKEAELRRLDRAKRNRDTLIREVHHRIKNHLQGVIGLLRHHLDSADAHSSLRQAINQIGAIATVYGLQSGQPGDSIRFCDMVASVVDLHTSISASAIDFSQQVVTPARLHSEEAVPVALIVNEIITNALKHSTSHENANAVSVELRVESGAAHLWVRNHGKKLPSQFDFSAGKGLGTGLQLIRSLLPPKGMQVSIRGVGRDVHAHLELRPPVIA